MSNDITTLRSILFESLRDIKKASSKDELEIALAKAKAISDTSQTLINSVKIEVDYIRATSSHVATGFIGAPMASPTLPKPPAKAVDKREIKTGVVETQGNVTRHVMR